MRQALFHCQKKKIQGHGDPTKSARELSWVHMMEAENLEARKQPKA